VTCPIADLRGLANQFSRPAAGEDATQQALLAILSRDFIEVEIAFLFRAF